MRRVRHGGFGRWQIDDRGNARRRWGEVCGRSGRGDQRRARSGCRCLLRGGRGRDLGLCRGIGRGLCEARLRAVRREGRLRRGRAGADIGFAGEARGCGCLRPRERLPRSGGQGRSAHRGGGGALSVLRTRGGRRRGWLGQRYRGRGAVGSGRGKTHGRRRTGPVLRPERARRGVVRRGLQELDRFEPRVLGIGKHVDRRVRHAAVIPLGGPLERPQFVVEVCIRPFWGFGIVGHWARLSGSWAPSGADERSMHPVS